MHFGAPAIIGYIVGDDVTSRFASDLCFVSHFFLFDEERWVLVDFSR